jgi:hypothetical protein
LTRYQFVVLPGPPFKVAQKSGQEGGNNRYVRELYLPMQHSVISRVSDALDEPSIRGTG